MTPRTFLGLAAATVIMVAAAVVAVNREPGFEPPAGVGTPAVPGLLDRVNDVRRIELDLPKAKLVIEDKDGWKVRDSDGYPARAVQVKRAILGLARLTLAEPKTKKPENFDKLELRDPGVDGAKVKRVRLYDGEGTMLADLLVGRRRAQLPGSTTGGVYVRKPGDNQAWLASGDASIESDRREWLERTIMDLSPGRVRSVKVSHPDGETYVISKAAPGPGDFTLEDIPPGKKLISKGGPNSIGRGLTALLLDDARKDAGQFDGLNPSVAEFTTFDGLRLTAHVAELADGKHWMRISAAADGDDAPMDEIEEINRRTGGWVYRISEYAASNITKRIEFLIEDAKPKS